MTDIQPALTPEQWATVEQGEWVEWVARRRALRRYRDGAVEVSDGEETARIELDEDKHATAALCLHGQPFGFTQADVGVLTSLGEWRADEPIGLRLSVATLAGLISLRNRIIALIPPP